MPKYGIHHIVLSDAVLNLHLDPAAASQDAASVLDTNKDIAMLGAVGPDLFFWAPDYEFVEKLYRFYRNYKDILDLINRVVQPIRDIRDAVVQPVEDAVESLAPSTVALIEKLIQEMKETAELFKATLSTGLFAGVIEGFNFLTDLASLPSASAILFQYFKPPLQDNESEKKWYWFDMLHYRNTGDFARNLVSNAVTSKQRAYAFGYLSHIATDLVGHAFVNQVVGGPYRMHVQRHVTVENWMDCRKYLEYYGESINKTLVDRLGLPEKLPKEIGDLIHKSFIDTYSGVNIVHPTRLIDAGLSSDGFLTRKQIDQTHEIFIEILKIMKDMYVPRPEEPFSGVADILSDALRDLLEPPPFPPPSPPAGATATCDWDDILSFGLTEDSRECYENFFEELSEWFDYLRKLLEWSLETFLDLIDLLVTTLLSLPVAVLLAILYGIQLLLYQIYQIVRSVLALEGFIFPEPEDLNSSHGRNLTTTTQCPTILTGPIMSFLYPKRTALSVSHLVCAPPVFELPKTRANLLPSDVDITADQFISILPFNLANLTAYAISLKPSDTINLERIGLSIGNATDLTAFMINTANGGGGNQSVAFTNWNLDSDRGYGYKTWKGALTLPADSIVEQWA